MEYSPDELFEEILLYNKDELHSISFTGGEPLLQKDFLKEIMLLTKRNGYKNYLETNGTLFSELKDVIDHVDIVAMDIKLPSSSAMNGLWGLHEKFLDIASRKEVFVKIIISGQASEEDLKKALTLIRDVNRQAVVILQPDSYSQDQISLYEKVENFKKTCSDYKILSCIIPQMHKRIGIR
jgi:organic radical activating enzyme